MKNIIKSIELEPITIKSGMVYATDPCYAKAEGAQEVIEVRKGEYKCRVEIANCGTWGNRIATLTIAHESETAPLYNDDKFTEWVGDACVDSGQCGFFDKDYYESMISDMNNIDEDWYRQVCDITMDKRADYCGTINGEGVVSESGYGDGLYAIYAAIEKNAEDKYEIVALKLDFLGILDPEDDDYEDDDD